MSDDETQQQKASHGGMSSSDSNSAQVLGLSCRGGREMQKSRRALSVERAISLTRVRGGIPEK